MAVVFDTADLPERDRLDAFRAMVVDHTVPSTAILEPGPRNEPLRGRLESWSLGTVQVIHTTVNHLMDLQRTPRQVRRGCEPMISMAITGTVSRHEQYGVTRTVPRSAMMCNDLTMPYRVAQTSGHDGFGLHIPIDELGLPPETIREGALHLARSPLYDLMSAHLTAVTRSAGQFPDPEVAAGIGRASIELTRAVLLSAAGGRRDPASGDALLTQVRTYITHHLADPRLGPERIAAALNVSVRHLYQVCARGDFSIEQWIIAQRLQRARHDLADPALAHEAVAAIARRHGFRSAAHFSRRFRTAYDVSPTDWRRIAAGA